MIDICRSREQVSPPPPPPFVVSHLFYTEQCIGMCDVQINHIFIPFFTTVNHVNVMLNYDLKIKLVCVLL